MGNLGSGTKGFLVKTLIGLSGLILALPAGGLFGFSQISLLLTAAAFLALGIVIRIFLGKSDLRN